MNSKIKILITVIVLIILSTFLNGQLECNSTNTPQLKFPLLIELNEGESFSYDINLSNKISDVTYSWIPINISINKIEIDRNTGILTVEPEKGEYGRHTIYIVATAFLQIYTI